MRTQGLCPVCNVYVTLKKDGTVRAHGVCSGWGRNPIKGRVVMPFSLRDIEAGTLFNTPFEKGCVVTVRPDDEGKFLARNLIGEESEYILPMVSALLVPVREFTWTDDYSFLRELTCRNHPTANYLTKNPWNRSLLLVKFPDAATKECECLFDDLVVVVYPGKADPPQDEGGLEWKMDDDVMTSDSVPESLFATDDRWTMT